MTPLEHHLAESVAELLPLARRLLWLQMGLDASRDARIVRGLQLLAKCDMAEDARQPELRESER